MNPVLSSKRTLLGIALCGSALFTSVSATACDGDSDYIGSICMTAANYCPSGHVEAAGQLLPISSNTALYSLLSTRYGGDGQTTFGVPDLRGRTPVGTGVSQSGLTPVNLASKRGAQSVTLSTAQMPPHTHQAGYNPTSSQPNLAIDIPVSSNTGTTTVVTPDATHNKLAASPAGLAANAANIWGATLTPATTVQGASASLSSNAGNVTVGVTGAAAPVPTVPPSSAIRYCVVTVGYYPPRP